MSTLKFEEVFKVNGTIEREELRKSIMETMRLIQEKADGIEVTKRLKWIDTHLKNTLNEKKPVISEKRAEDARKRAREYYNNHRKVVLDKNGKRRKNAMDKVQARLNETD